MAKKKKEPVILPGQLDMLEQLGQKIAVNYTKEQEDFINYERISYALKYILVTIYLINQII